MLYETPAGLPEVSQAYCKTDFLQTTLLIPRKQFELKKNEDFVQLLVAFGMSNISYWMRL